ncbi:hypothetical protein SeMB42_g07745 [Synchytrium endobioticum]|uniref:ATP-dependent (S)-NAD(P)H-hydrate dehydratase n=1 Tax=Synchytrium endobioticum TaxID=286115 RepID=A0A507CER6_9FUNG|nr:hypothetical protein SeMB42_g07745 [Synchytrium endobioticum]TPX36404.1 hypothetical protein SeLEV6574_g08064 [Synchytrium endobioticum]
MTSPLVPNADKDALVAAIRKFLPPLSQSLHKGQSGRIAVVGGSEEYTGAPFFAGYSALRLGADLCHVFCEESAATIIKSYSPELIVHSYLHTSDHIPTDSYEPTIEKIVSQVTQVFPRLHVILVGPGLSRDDSMMDCAKRIIKAAREHEKPLVIDADGLYAIQTDPSIIKDYPLAVLTPNANEFRRLCDIMNVTDDTDTYQKARALSQAFGNVTIVQKGEVDIISNGYDVITCDAQGAPRRCGGQGDLLSGTLAAFLAFGNGYATDNWRHGNDFSSNTSFLSKQLPLLAAYGACLMVRGCAKEAYKKMGRAMMTTDMIEEIGNVFADEFEDGEITGKR